MATTSEVKLNAKLRALSNDFFPTAGSFSNNNQNSLSLLVNAAKYVSKSSYMRLIFCNACTVLISKSNIALLYIDSTSSSDEQAISSDTCKFSLSLVDSSLNELIPNISKQERISLPYGAGSSSRTPASMISCIVPRFLSA